ncbi:Protein of unknown function DUF2368 family-containing protein [Strongyloides ratti]|uniref:Uncharacterized protein n=1 Tax=Strongyloides ratti TaxID=34506 RepID=A0A090KU45_STRRB|nr:Protein of unknown function DUF2368 family-containing protein [Strongyloides ratti]CEF61035.1 Protein of unknown function DUF2368 family-containing protein [Strongyloides ratti]
MFNWFFGRQNESNVNEELVKKIVLELEAKKIEREIALKEAFLEREKAYNLARKRELFPWAFTTSLFLSLVSISSYIQHKNIIHLLPMGVITGYLTYQAHDAFGNKEEIIIKNASQLLEDDESRIISFIPITIEEINKRKNQNESDYF